MRILRLFAAVASVTFGCSSGGSDSPEGNPSSDADPAGDAAVVDGDPGDTPVEPDADASPPGPRTFVHPGLLHTEADFARMKAKVAAAEHPWIDGWNALTGSGFASLTRTPRPLETVVRGGDGSNFAQLLHRHRRCLRDRAALEGFGRHQIRRPVGCVPRCVVLDPEVHHRQR